MSEKVLKNENLRGSVKLLPNGEITLIKSKEEAFLEYLRKEKQLSFELGKIEGEIEGRKKVKEEINDLFTLLETLSLKLNEEKKRLIDNLKPEIIEFSLATSEKIIRSELKERGKLITLIDSLIHQTLNFGAKEPLKVFLSKEDFKMVESHFLMDEKKNLKQLSLFSDPSLNQGEVKIENKTHFFNFSIARELEDLRSNVLRQ